MSLLNSIYSRMYSHYGPQGWWPGDTPFEIAVGAILTQNVAWVNVSKAIANLKEEKLVTPKKLAGADPDIVKSLIRPAGYYNQKAQTLRDFLSWFSRYRYSFPMLQKRDTDELRRELIMIKRIGPETADSILLYALERKLFVVDAYTKRIFSRVGVLNEEEGYQQVQEFFHRDFTGEIQEYNEYHALIVAHGKDVCKKNPLCDQCCIKTLCLQKGVTG
ncbi:MAG: endonuclease III domain-containing protein [Spirochaetota bacterium]